MKIEWMDELVIAKTISQPIANGIKAWIIFDRMNYASIGFITGSVVTFVVFLVKGLF